MSKRFNALLKKFFKDAPDITEEPYSLHEGDYQGIEYEIAAQNNKSQTRLDFSGKQWKERFDWERSTVEQYHATGDFFNLYKDFNYKDILSATFARNSDCITSELCDVLAGLFSNRFIYTRDHISTLLGEYFQPLVASGFLSENELASDIARSLKVPQITNTDPFLKVIFPHSKLVNILMGRSARLSHIFHLAIAEIQKEARRAKQKERKAEYPAIAIKIDSLLADPNSILNKGLKFNSFPPNEVRAVAQLINLHSPDFKEPRAIPNWPEYFYNNESRLTEIQRRLPVSINNGGLAIIEHPFFASFAISFSPKLLQAAYDSVAVLKCRPSPDSQVFPPQAILTALSSADRLSFLTSTYGLLVSRQMLATQSGDVSAASIKKLLAALYPSISPSVFRMFFSRIIGIIFRKCKGLGSEVARHIIFLETILREGCDLTKQLGHFESISKVVSACLWCPDNTWISIKEIKQTHPGFNLNIEYMFGWFAGFIDLAFKLDKKGLKSEILAIRVNQKALKALLIPERKVFDLHQDLIKNGAAFSKDSSKPLISRPTHSYKVDILPTGEILVPPDIHPGIKMCLATLLTTTSANSFLIPNYNPVTPPPLDLSELDIGAFLMKISRGPLPKIIADRFFKLEDESSREKLSLFAPTFVVTQASEETAKELLNSMGSNSFFSVEIAPSVWGFYRKSFASCEKGEPYHVDAFHHWGTDPHRMLKESFKLGKRVNTTFSDIKVLGDFKNNSNDLAYVTSMINATVQPAFEEYINFFELTLLDERVLKNAAGVELFSLIPEEIRSDRAFKAALGPCYNLDELLVDEV